MSLRVNVQGGTGAGTRKPYTDAHAPTCQCTRCERALLHEAGCPVVSR